MNQRDNRLAAVAKLSLRLAAKYVQPYSCVKSPHLFTQPQRITCLILRAYLKTTYRGVIEVLEVSNALRKTLHWRRIPHPHYLTLKYFTAKSGEFEIIDATGLETLL